MLFEGSMQHHSSSLQTPTNTSPHACSLPSDSSAPHKHSAKWTESLRDLSKPGWIKHSGTNPGAPDTVIDSEGFDEKGHVSTDTENDERHNATSWRREKKKRRRKAEIYVSVLFV